MMSSKSVSSAQKSATKVTKPTAPPVSRAQTNLSRSAASSSQSLNSSASETQSQSTVRASSIRRSTSSNEILTENIDDFAIGDKVWVNGQRPGIIKFLGDTKFAPGKWSGIELDSDDGKNDGSIGGIRYFDCPPNYGVFVRPQRLTKKQIEETKSSNKSSPVRETSPLTPTAIEKHQHLLNSTFNKSNGSSNGSKYENKFQVGDRVLVNATSGTKLGTLMFLGETDFATGFWAGIELDEALGKNDGSVAGKRYFKCEMKYGLFAPIHKISAAPLSALKVVKKSTAKTRPSISRQRSGSQESLNSVASSTASSTRPNRVRLGVTSLSSSQKGSKSSSQQLAANITANNSALNDVVKEKEEHITQLLKERDLERGEVARAAAQADALEEKLAALQSEHNKFLQEADEEIEELKRLNQEYEEMQLKINTQLEDEKKKTEDLQFRLEEETIVRADLESQISVLNEGIGKLKAEIKANSELSLKSSSEQVEALVDKLKTLENQRENDIFALQEDIVRKEEAVFQLEASMEKRNTELANLQSRILEFEQELDVAKQRNDRHLESIDKFNLIIKKEESNKRLLSDENTRLRQQLKESEKQLIVMEERIDEMSSGKKEVEIVSKRVKDLEREIESKENIERQLEESLLETKAKYEKFEGEVNSLAEQLTKMRSLYDQEIKRKTEAENTISQLSESNRNLESKIENLMRTSGTNSDLLIKMNAEIVQKQKEFLKQEKALKDEIENIRREKELRDSEIRELRIDGEDKKSIISKFEKKEKEFDKLIQSNENELKLTRIDCDEKQTLVNDLRQQLSDIKTKLNSLTREQEIQKGDLEFKLSQLERDHKQKEQELDASHQELRNLRDIKFELEIERDRFKRDSERHEKTANERQQLIDNMRQDVIQMKDEFNKYRKDLENQLENTKQNHKYLDELGSELEDQKKVCHEVEEENQSLRDDNRHLREKVEELRDDIEAIEKRHQEVLAEFEFECERLQNKIECAEQLADDRQSRLIELEGQQSLAIDTFRRSAETEKRQLERKLDELELRVRESIANANVRRYEQEIDGKDNYEQQIEFLNSVIVDMQKKNDELKNRVQVLEEIGLGEFDSSFQSRVRVNGHIRAPRVFCDICDIFDLHETEDCPQQSSIENDSRSHTYYHAIRNESRPYCSVCEMFGHSTSDCPENETF